MSKQLVSPSLKNAMPFLKLVSKLPDRSRKIVLKELGGDETAYNAIHEMAFNAIKGNVSLKNSQKKKLKKHQKVLQNFCCKKNKKCLNKRKKLIVQSGGFLPILIPAIASLLGSILTK